MSRFKKYKYVFIIILLFFINVRAEETLIFDHSYFTDWTRVKTSYFSKYKDTILDGHSLIKIDIKSLSGVDSIISARIFYYTSKVKETGNTLVYEVSDSLWSICKDPNKLYNWPASSLIKKYTFNDIGWRNIDIAESISRALSNGSTNLSLKFEVELPAREFIASPSFPLTIYCPYVVIKYKGEKRPADLSIYSGDIETDPPFPEIGMITDLKLCIRNIGTIKAENLEISLFRGDPDINSIPVITDTVISIQGQGGTVSLNYPWTVQSIPETVYVWVDPVDKIQELNETNNRCFYVFSAQDTGTIVADFENVTDIWRYDSDVPQDVNTGNPRAWSMIRSDSISFSDSYGLKLYLDGRSDDGTIWMERKLLFSASEKRTVNLEFQLWSEFQSDFNRWPVVAYIDTVKPEVEADFSIIGRTDKFAGWEKYSFQKKINTGKQGMIWIAAGIGATWESERTYFIDDVRIFSQSSDTYVSNPCNNQIQRQKNLILNNYPNPFNSSTSIIFEIQQPCKISLRVYDITGKLVRSLLDRKVRSNTNTVTWYGYDNSGFKVGSGIYFAVLQTSHLSKTIRIAYIQ